MALNDNDLFLVNQGGESKKIQYGNLKSNILGAGAGVQKIIAGNNITISPSSGVGEVTINGQAGGGGGGDTNITYSGAAAWMHVSNRNNAGSLNCNLLRTGNGTYDVTFVNPMPDGNYAVTVSSEAGTIVTINNTQTAEKFSLNLRTYDGNSPVDDVDFAFAVHALNAMPPRGGTGADAWVNHQTPASNGEVPINSSFNIESVTRTGAGEYTAKFTTPMPDATYAVLLTPNSGSDGMSAQLKSQTNTEFSYTVANLGGTPSDVNTVSVVVHATNAQLPDTITQDQLDAITAGFTGVAAWGNIDGVNATLRGGLNCSVSRNTDAGAVGRYIVKFDRPMPDANYSVSVGNQASRGLVGIQTLTPTQFEITSVDESSGAFSDFESLQFAVHALNALPPKGGTGTDAWGVFSGNDPGTIQGSFNIASITRNSVGNYSVVFTNPMPDTQYAVVGSCWNAAADTAYTFLVTNKSSTGFDYVTLRDVGQAGDGTISYSDQAASFTVNASSATLPLTITEDQIAALIQNPTISAWGSTDGGTPPILRDPHFNIDTIVRNSTGNYTITFDKPLSTANYAVSVVLNTNTFNGFGTVKDRTTTGFTVETSGQGGNAVDSPFSVIVAGTARNGTLGGGADAWGAIAGAAATPDADRVLGGFNIQSVQRTGDGQYTINFANDMPNANYSVVASPVTGVNADRILVGTKQVDSFTLSYFNTVDTGVNANFNFAVFATDGNAGGFWVKTGDELAPLSDTADVKIGGGAINLDPASQVKSEVPFWYDSTLPKAFNNTAFQASGTDGIGAIVSSNGTHLIGGDLDKPFGSMSPNITLNADGSGTFNDEIKTVAASTAIGGYRHLLNDSGYYQQDDANNSSVSITKDGSAMFAGNVTAPNVFFSLDDGSTFAVKDRILNLISRLDAIEANEQIDDATDTSLLQLVANASARLDSIEARLSALEGGN